MVNMYRYDFGTLDQLLFKQMLKTRCAKCFKMFSNEFDGEEDALCESPNGRYLKGKLCEKCDLEDNVCGSCNSRFSMYNPGTSWPSRKRGRYLCHHCR